MTPLTFPGVTGLELGQMLTALMKAGGSVRTTTAVSGTVTMHKIFVTVKAGYSLADDGTLTLTPDGHPDEVRKHIQEFLDKTRAGKAA